MKKIILTGFEPFGNYQFNPTKDSTLKFDGKKFGDRKITGVVLPCLYDAWTYLADVIEEINPYAIISTGFASCVGGMRIESSFRNLMDSKYSDASGYSPKGLPIIAKDAPNNVTTNALYEELFLMLVEHGIPAEYSMDAESFICNALGYQTSLAIQRQNLPIRNAFIHVPWTTEYKDKVPHQPGKIFIDHDVYNKGLELLIRNI